MLVFESIYTEGLAQISYLVGDSKAAVAAVIDPRRDVEVTSTWRATRACASPMPSRRTSTPTSFPAPRRWPNAAAPRSSADYAFGLRQVDDGEVLELGQVSLEVLHSPGHTPEHISLLLRDSQQGEAPFALFTGDTLFNLDVGRPDLLGEDSTKQRQRSSTPRCSPATCRSANASRSTPATAPARPAANPSVTVATPPSANGQSLFPPARGTGTAG